MANSRSVDLEFEKDYKPIVTHLIFSVLTRVNHQAPNAVSYVSDNINKNQMAADRYLSVDVTAYTPGIPNNTIQVKVRRFGQYKFFQWKPDILIGLKKRLPDGFTCDSDYVKCNSQYYFYGFLNEEETEFVYWVLFDWAKARNKFTSIGGWEKLEGAKTIDIPDGDGRISTCIVMPWFHMQECIVIDKTEFENPIKKLDDSYSLTF